MCVIFVVCFFEINCEYGWFVNCVFIVVGIKNIELVVEVVVYINVVVGFGCVV